MSPIGTPGNYAATASEASVHGVGDGTVGIGLIGTGFMGQAHSYAWATVSKFFSVGSAPSLVVVAGRDRATTASFRRRNGWQRDSLDWRAVVEAPDVDIVDICVPSDQHVQIVKAALDAGKHVLCEKPLANSLSEAMTLLPVSDRATARGVHSMVGFNYRRLPAIALARQIVEAGELGTIRQIRGTYLQDWLSDSSVPMQWRLRAEVAGSGALGDLGSHLVDSIQHVTGLEVDRVSAVLRTFTTSRPVTPEPTAAGFGPISEPVTVDDAAWLTTTFRDGDAICSLDVSRVAKGRPNQLSFEIFGASASISFDSERLNELTVHGDSTARGSRRIQVLEMEDPYMAAWWGGSHPIGWDHSFIHQASDLLSAVRDDRAPEPGIRSACQVQAVLQAAHVSHTSGGQWVAVDHVAQRTGLSG